MGLALGSALVVAVFAAIFRSEFEAWMPWLAERLRRFALRSFHGSMRERLDEEWSAFLGEVPGSIGKIVCAIGFNVAAQKIHLQYAVSHIVFHIMHRYAEILVKLAHILNKPTDYWIGGDIVLADVSRIEFATLLGSNMCLILSARAMRIASGFLQPQDESEREAIVRQRQVIDRSEATGLDQRRRLEMVQTRLAAARKSCAK